MNKKIFVSISIIILLVFSIVGCDSEKNSLIDFDMELSSASVVVGIDGVTENKTRGTSNITKLIKANLTSSQMELLSLNRGSHIYTNFSIDSSMFGNTVNSEKSFDGISPDDLKDMNNAIIKIGNLIDKKSWILIPDDYIVYQEKIVVVFTVITPWGNRYYFIDEDGDGKPDYVIDQNGNTYSVDFIWALLNGDNDYDENDTQK